MRLRTFYSCVILIMLIIMPLNGLKATQNSGLIESGFVFVDGKYIEAPYSVETRNFAVYINGIQITKELEWPILNEYAFDHDPGYPPNVTKFMTFEESFKLREPSQDILYNSAKQWYLFTHFSYEEAFEQTIQYFRSLPNVTNLTKDHDGGWILESYAGEKRHILFGGPVMRRVNQEFGPNGSGPISKDEVTEQVNNMSNRYENRLKKGDLFIIFSHNNEISFAERKAANLLPELLNTMKSTSSIIEKADELIALGLLPRTNIELGQFFAANFSATKQLDNRIMLLRQEIERKYGLKYLKPIKKNQDLKMINDKEAKINSSFQRDRTEAYSPDGTFLYGWCGYTYDSAFGNFSSSEISSVGDYIRDQDYNVSTCIYTDDQGDDDNCEECTYQNLQNMKYSDLLYIAVHGDESTSWNGLLLILLETEDQINNWSSNDSLILPREVTWENWTNGHPWTALAHSNWASTYWNPILTQSNAISILSCCYSFENGWVADCGGGVAFGYNQSCSGSNCETNNEQLLRRMNGTLENGEKRSAGEAYDDMPAHLDQFRIVPVGADITLCPATKNYEPEDGDEVPPTGTGYFEVDTYCSDNIAADEVLTFTTTGEITIENIHWVGSGQVNRIEYDWAGSGEFEVVVEVHHDNLRSWGAATTSYHNLDFDGVSPNSEDGEYSFRNYNGLEVALVLDRSGSMGYENGNKMAKAKLAATQFVQILSEGDEIAVCSFSSGSSTDYSMSTISNMDMIQEIIYAIDGITSGGGTAIHQGILEGQGQLNSCQLPSEDQGMVLMSDGLSSANDVYSVLNNIPTTTDIYSIGFGSDCDEELMRNIANLTDGKYYFAYNDGSNIGAICQNILFLMKDQDIFAFFHGLIHGFFREEILEYATIDDQCDHAIFNLTWEHSDSEIDIVLLDPEGNEINPDVAAGNDNINFSSFSTQKYYAVTDPLPGEWIIQLSGSNIPYEEGEAYDLIVSGETQVRMSIEFNDDEYYTGDPIGIIATLTDNDQPSLGATVTAELESQSRNREEITLFDDGSHGDGDAEDGVYANEFTGMFLEGSYTVYVNSEGTTNSGFPYTRYAFESTYVSQPEYIGVINGSVEYAGDQVGDIVIRAILVDTLGNETIFNTEEVSQVGVFSVTNLADGNYQIDAFVDLNGNGLYESNEPYGSNEFLTEIISQGITSGILITIYDGATRLPAGWNMIGVPVTANDNSPVAIFADDIDPFYVNPAYSYIKQYDWMTGLNVPSTIVPGTGYWLLVNEDNTLVDAYGMISTDDLTLDLEGSLETDEGWYLIANPYNDTLSFDSGMTCVNVGEYGYHYSPEINGLVTIGGFTGNKLAPWQGMVVKATNPTASLAFTMPITREGEIETENWELVLTAEDSQGTAFFTAGAYEHGLDGYDNQDVPVLPEFIFMPQNDLKLLAEHPDWGDHSSDYLRDIQALSRESWQWELNLTASETVLLKLDNSFNIPEEYDILLYDYSEQTFTNLREECLILEFGENSSVAPAIKSKRFSLRIAPDLGDDNNIISYELNLQQNYPNPFCLSGERVVTKFDFEIPQQSNVEFSIYNIKGQKIISLLNEIRPAGQYSINWDGRNSTGTQVSSGLYFYNLKTDNKNLTKKMLILR